MERWEKMKEEFAGEGGRDEKEGGEDKDVMLSMRISTTGRAGYRSVEENYIQIKRVFVSFKCGRVDIFESCEEFMGAADVSRECM